jgi:hypothetical protein
MDNISSDEKALVLHEEPISKQQLIHSVQQWVLADTQLKQLNEKTKSVREIKSTATSTITSYMKQHQYKGNIKISDGELRICEKKEYSPLTYGYIERCLANIIPEETHVAYIINYLKENREITTSQDIKRICTKL